MSADLLAEFEAFSQPPQPPQHPPQPIQNDEDDDDAWGDFEVAPTTGPVNDNSASAVVENSSRNFSPNTRVVRASTLDLVSNNVSPEPEPTSILENRGAPAWPSNSTSSGMRVSPETHGNVKARQAPERDPNVLFDAELDGPEDEADDDDFGDFETSTPPPAGHTVDLLSLESSIPVSHGQPASDLLSGLSLHGHSSSSSYPAPPRSPSFQERNPFPGLALTTPPKDSKVKRNQESKPTKGATPVTAWPSVDQSPGFNNSEDWGSFEDFPEELSVDNKNNLTDWDWKPDQPTKTKPVKAKPAKPKGQKIAPVPQPELDSSWDWDPVDVATGAEKENSSKEDDMPPINIPPPSILLSIFPQLLGEANAKLYKPIGGQPSSVKNRVLSDTKTLEFLRGYLVLATVAARVIAGRKLRWHRDKFLAQGMSISAAGSKGMKLAGVDKAQTARESREAGDVVDVWKEHVGRLRSAVAAANSTLKNSSEQLKVPEISETMQVQTAKFVPTAPKACLICGLKRDERVNKVDYEIEDSFGEWWADHWGHTSCKRFWLKHESALRSR